MVVKDWALEAAAEIVTQRLAESGVMVPHELFNKQSDEIKKIIEKHCPFKPDVAYEAVTDRVKYAIQLLTNIGVDVNCGACLEVAFTGLTAAPHNCQKTLLQCSHCSNTESPAGAMARQWNHGRCMHCGGYFKVVRA